MVVVRVPRWLHGEQQRRRRAVHRVRVPASGVVIRGARLVGGLARQLAGRVRPCGVCRVFVNVCEVR